MNTKRLLHVGIVFALLVAALVLRLFQLQVLEHSSWVNAAEKSRTEKTSLTFKRGRILDRQGKTLAFDSPSHDLQLVYRDFRRGVPYKGIAGHLSAQLLETTLLLPSEFRSRIYRYAGVKVAGLVDCQRRAEALGAALLQLRPTDFAALNTRQRSDLKFYFRWLYDLKYDSLDAWLQQEAVPLGDWASGAADHFAQRVKDSAAALEKLETALLLDQGELLQRIEHQRLWLEQRLRRRCAQQAAGSLDQISGAQVIECLDKDVLTPNGVRTADELLASLMEAWQLETIDFDAAQLELLLRFGTVNPGDDSNPDDKGATVEQRLSEMSRLLQQIERTQPKHLAGVRRANSLNLHDQARNLVANINWHGVDLIAQNPQYFAGLRAAPRSRRTSEADTAIALIGRVGEPTNASSRDVQQLERAEYDRLRRQLHRSHAQQLRFDELRKVVRLDHIWNGEFVGLTGLEQMYEEQLRGKRGYVDRLHSDDDGAGMRELAFVPSRNGNDLHMTLDLELLKAAERAIEDGYAAARRYLRDDPRPLRQALIPGLQHPKAGLVIIDLKDGSVPVLASVPTYTADDLRDNYHAVLNNPRRPMAHRALGHNFLGGREAPYPGSTFKLLVAYAALMKNRAYWDQVYTCAGEWEGLKCDAREGHWDINMRDAIKQSCNVYFYQLADAIGYSYMYDVAMSLGFGERTGVLGGLMEMPPARMLPDAPLGPSRGGGVRKTTLDRGRQFAIGQSHVVASPLQVARFYGWLATGKLWRPRLVAQVGADAVPAEAAPDSPLLPTDVQALLYSAMIDVVEDAQGTAYGDALENFGVAGKTGTAQVERSSGSKPSTVHSWFVGFFPHTSPRYVAAVFCENTGLHGGEISTKILREFLMSDAFAPYLVAD